MQSIVKKFSFEKSLHYVTKGLLTSEDLPHLWKAIKGGVDVVQLRPKTQDDVRDIYLNAQWLKSELAPFPVLLIINNHLDIALDLELGVHLGQRDYPYLRARKLMGEEAIIGLSIEKEEEAFEAKDWDVEYFGAGVYPSSTKPGYSNLGLDGIGRIKQFVTKPVVAIGGIKVENALQVSRVADGLAVVGAIADAPHPEQVARQLKEAICSQI
ncbi:MAG: thiamine phosphate synthase [Verrucomicrobia bacterium]|nr:thiamine phosphate synthase [Verrucomicrobiota bacterium]